MARLGQKANDANTDGDDEDHEGHDDEHEEEHDDDDDDADNDDDDNDGETDSETDHDDSVTHNAKKLRKSIDSSADDAMPLDRKEFLYFRCYILYLAFTPTRCRVDDE